MYSSCDWIDVGGLMWENVKQHSQKLLLGVVLLPAVLLWGLGRHECERSGSRLQGRVELVDAPDLANLQLRDGRVVKEGTLDYRYSQLFSTDRIPTNSSHSWKDQQYQRQYQAIKRIGESLSEEAPTTEDVEIARDYLDCPVWVNHKYKLVYIRIQKTGSTAIIKHFTRCGSQTENPDTCLDTYHEHDRGVNEELWRSYFVFATVRNPYARYVSIFNYLTEDGREKPKCASYGYTWPQFCSDPVTAMEYCSHNRKCCRGKAFMEELYFRHTLPQSRCLATEGGAWAVDYLVRTENLEQDLKAMIDHINEQRHAQGSDVPAIPAVVTQELGVVNPSPHSSYLDFYGDTYPGCLDSARRFYKDDFNLLVAP